MSNLLNHLEHTQLLEKRTFLSALMEQLEKKWLLYNRKDYYTAPKIKMELYQCRKQMRLNTSDLMANYGYTYQMISALNKAKNI